MTVKTDHARTVEESGRAYLLLTFTALCWGGNAVFGRLADIACMSPFHFARLFRGSTGVAPHAFVVRKRIAHAATLLVAPDLSIARISRVVGFRTPSHFSTVFRRLTGSTPSAYRARYLGGCDERL
jgi:AraC-like DNA-binding protein